MNAPVSAIIAYSKLDFLDKCVESLLKQALRPSEIILINNASKPLDTKAFDFGDIKLIHKINKENRLFAQAMNDGIRLANNPIILLINSDVVLDRYFIKELMPNFSIDERIAMASGLVLRFDGLHIDTKGLILSRSRRPLEIGYGKLANIKPEEPKYIFSGPSCAVLMKKEMLDEVAISGQYFDENYGLFYEDLDLAWRAHRLGWKAYYNPNALAYHVRGASVKEVTPKLWFLKNHNLCYLSDVNLTHLVKNRYLTLIKNESPDGFIANIAFILAYDIKLWLYLVFFRINIIPAIFINLKKYIPDALKWRAHIRETYAKSKK